jgi:hypothetical protein
MKVDLRITGGTWIDPDRGLHGPGEVLIKGNRIVSPGQGRPSRLGGRSSQSPHVHQLP